MTTLDALLAKAEDLYMDTRYEAARAWKAAAPGRAVVGHAPVFAPVEVIVAAGALPLAVAGAGDRVDVIRGDAYFQSYICRIPRSILELAFEGNLDFVDLMVFPSTCDVIRNLSGVWTLAVEDQPAFFLDVPQGGGAPGGGLDTAPVPPRAVREGFWASQLRQVWERVAAITGASTDPESLRAAIRLANDWRGAVRELYDARAEEPWKFPAGATYLVLAAGDVLPLDEHAEMVRDYVRLSRARDLRRRDNIRVVVQGSFCERPPLGLVRTLDRAGLYVVDDDFVLYSRWYERDIDEEGDPLANLARAFFDRSRTTATVYERDQDRAQELVARARRRRADGVVLMAASFCDPALLDRPALTAALQDAGIPVTDFKFAENTSQFSAVREQVGTFSDSVRLWSRT